MSVELPMYRYGEMDGRTVVDDDVAALVGGRRLTRCGGYVFLGRFQLHRTIMGCVRGDGLVVHHINEDTTDNRRANLKVCDGVFGHGDQPHPWRDRVSCLAQRYGGMTARALVEYERECHGLRPIGGEVA